MDQNIIFVGLSSMPIDQRIVACFRIDNDLVFQGKEAICETVKTMPEQTAYKQAFYMLTNPPITECLKVFPEVTDAFVLLDDMYSSRNSTGH